MIMFKCVLKQALLLRRRRDSRLQVRSAADVLAVQLTTCNIQRIMRM